MLTDLQQRWLTNWQTAGGEPTAGQSSWQCLQAAYEAPHRHYHTLTHLSECFTWFDQLSSDLSHEERVLLSFAIWFHDVVYDPTQSDNEWQSAELALSRLSNTSLTTHQLQQLHQMILATTNHSSKDPLTQHLLDIDLSILAAPAVRFAEFEQQIRAEYLHVPIEQFAAGRSKVLQHFLAMQPLYRHPALAKLTNRARENLAASIQYWAVLAAEKR